jgi:hypothetical protein
MTKKREKPFHLDMSFDEALKRYAQTDSREPTKANKKPTKATKKGARSRSNPKLPSQPNK